MDSTEIPLLILGTTVATYIPRAIPTVLVDKMRLGVKAERYSRLTPYMATSALIFPTVFSVDTSNPAVGTAGGLVTGILAWYKCPVIVSVLAATGTDFILYCFL